MDKKRGIAILIFLVLLLGMIDAAWIFSYPPPVGGDQTAGALQTVSLHPFLPQQKITIRRTICLIWMGVHG